MKYIKSSDIFYQAFSTSILAMYFKKNKALVILTRNFNFV